MSFKRALKRPLQVFASRFGRHARRAARPELLILMYHRILPPDDPRARLEQPGMVVHPGTFRMHLTVLKRYLPIVSLTDWLNDVDQGRAAPGRACAITFDDGWADTYQHAFPVLREAGVPATVFLVSDMIGTGRDFWPGRLARLLDRLGARPELARHEAFQWLADLGVDLSRRADRAGVDEAINRAKTLTEAKLEERVAAMEAALDMPAGDAPPLMNWDQARAMADSGLVEMGSHTRHHVRMTSAVDEAVMRDEVAGSREEIERRLDRPVTLFCYPNGDFTPAAKALVSRHYRAACSTASGWHTAGDDRYALHRIGVHQDIAHDPTSFLARISGWL